MMVAFWIFQVIAIGLRAVEVITPVMNQGKCGSSWAFNMTGALEGVLAVCCHEGADGWTCHLVIARHGQHRSRWGVRYTSLLATISHDNHRTSKHASTSWRSDGSPSCLGGSSHGWVPVKTHSTPVPTSVGRLRVAHQLHNTQQ